MKIILKRSEFKTAKIFIKILRGLGHQEFEIMRANSMELEIIDSLAVTS